MKEPTYSEQLNILESFLESSISEQMKIDLIEAFCKRFGKTKEELLKEMLQK